MLFEVIYLHKMVKVKIITYGCAMNQADSEIMVGLLAEEGIEVGEDGDVIIVNTCTVKTPTERKVLRKLKELEEEDRGVIVTGCLPLVQPEVADEFKKFSFLGTNVKGIGKVVKQVKKGERVIKISQRREVDLSQRIRKNPFVEIIPISQGCLGGCSYCCVKLARGKLISLPKEKIIRQIKLALSEGVKEIWLTAQDTGAYGLEKGETLPSLLGAVSKIQGDFRVRVGMMNPNHVWEFLPELVKAYQGGKIYKFLHLPLQSGNDEVLKEMRRKYEVKEFKEIVRKFREEIPKITISTDLIVGFPTESEEQFQDSVKLIQEVKPDVLNISRYWQRPKTKAAKIKGWPGRETKRRSRIMDKIFQKVGLEQNRGKWLGWEGTALVSEKKIQGGYTARNFSYRPIIVKSRKNLLGKFVKVKVGEVTYYDLRGKVFYV